MKRLEFTYGGAGGFYLIPTIMLAEKTTMVQEHYAMFLFLKWHFTIELK